MFPHPDVFFPSARAVPAPVLRAFRQADPNVVVIWLRRGAWLLGSVLPNRHRQESAGSTRAKLWASSLAFVCTDRATLERGQQRWGDREAITRLRAQGVVEHQSFAADAYSEHVLWGKMETWLRYAQWIKQHCYEEYWRAMDADQERNEQDEEKLGQLLDKSRLREAYRMGFTNPVSRGWSKELDNATNTGGSGALTLQTA
jgi:hypothetical protein